MKRPLHERIRAEIEAKILSGAWAPGERIPFEHELTGAYGCSRMTVSKALSALASAGLIDRRKRAGSFVSRPLVHSMVLDIPDLEAEITNAGKSYEFRLLSHVIRLPDPDQSAEVELAGGGTLLVLRGLHLAGNLPIALENRLISLSAVPEARGVDFAAISPGAWLLRHVPWTEAENRIAAVNIDAKTANLLNISPGAACLAVQRRTWRGREHITNVLHQFVGDKYDLVARFGKAAS